MAHSWAPGSPPPCPLCCIGHFQRAVSTPARPAVLRASGMEQLGPPPRLSAGLAYSPGPEMGRRWRAGRGVDVVLCLFPARLGASRVPQLPSLWGEGHSHRPAHPPSQPLSGGRGTPEKLWGERGRPSQAAAMLRSPWAGKRVGTDNAGLSSQQLPLGLRNLTAARPVGSGGRSTDLGPLPSVLLLKGHSLKTGKLRLPGLAGHVTMPEPGSRWLCWLS